MNKVKEKLRNGGTVMVFNPNFPSAALAEHAGALGFDVAFIDCEHGPASFERAEELARAARAALDSAGIDPTAVTHIVTVSCTGFAAPNFDVGLIRHLGLRRTVERTHVGFMGCHGALNGLRVANGIAAGNPDACILVCAVELCSLHYQYGWNPDWLVANAIFADGAAAVVGGAKPPGGSDEIGRAHV